MTNFPLGSQVLTGLFLNVILSGPAGPATTYQETLLDQIGYAARQSGASQPVTIDPNAAPPLTSLNLYTVNISPGLQDPVAVASLSAPRSAPSRAWGITPNRFTPSHPAMLSPISWLPTRSPRPPTSRRSPTSSPATSPPLRASLPTSTGPAITVATINPLFQTSIDLLNDQIRALAYPGQNVDATQYFNGARGYFENVNETVTTLNASSDQPESTFTIFSSRKLKEFP